MMTIPHLRRTLTLIGGVLIMLASTVKPQTSSSPEPQQWLRYTVKGEEFSFALPTLPAMTTTRVFVARYDKRRVERVLTVKANGVVYSVFACENPMPKQSLDDFIAEQTAKSGLDQTTERRLNVGGFPGKEYSSPDKTKPATEQFFATEGHLYRFVASGAPADHSGVRQFFSSIKLGKKQEGIKVSEGPGMPLPSEPREKSFTGKEVDVKARLTSKPEPSYTDAARSAAIEGTVILKAIFSSSGEVVNIVVVQGLPYGLTERAIKAAKKIKFIPAMKDGRYVSMWMQLEYNFHLF